MEWKFQNDAPIYTQLVEQIRLRIAAGAYAPGERLPSVRDLALSAGVNPNTMQRALAELERIGLVFSQRTAGRFVTEDTDMIQRVREDLAEACIRRFMSEMDLLGYSPEEAAALLAATKKEEPYGTSGM